jgi:hypothetical protein
MIAISTAFPHDSASAIFPNVAFRATLYAGCPFVMQNLFTPYGLKSKIIDDSGRTQGVETENWTARSFNGGQEKATDED